MTTLAQYALPKFDVAVRTDRAWYGPGDVLSATIDARYFYGKLVAGGRADGHFTGFVKPSFGFHQLAPNETVGGDGRGNSTSGSRGSEARRGPT